MKQPTKAVRDVFKFLVNKKKIKSYYQVAKHYGQLNNQSQYKEAISYLEKTGDVVKNVLNEWVFSEKAEVLYEDFIREALRDDFFIDKIISKEKMTLIDLLNILKESGKVIDKRFSDKRSLMKLKGLQKFMKYDK